MGILLSKKKKNYLPTYPIFFSLAVVIPVATCMSVNQTWRMWIYECVQLHVIGGSACKVTQVPPSKSYFPGYAIHMRYACMI